MRWTRIVFDLVASNTKQTKKKATATHNTLNNRARAIRVVFMEIGERYWCIMVVVIELTLIIPTKKKTIHVRQTSKWTDSTDCSDQFHGRQCSWLQRPRKELIAFDRFRLEFSLNFEFLMKILRMIAVEMCSMHLQTCWNRKCCWQLMTLNNEFQISFEHVCTSVNFDCNYCLFFYFEQHAVSILIFAATHTLMQCVLF